ncbi:MAG: hypothetical protein ABMB14_25995, partial [Myxococcota bacterium]
PHHGPGAEMEAELFELELVGGAIERQYRAMRPEVEAMPWGTLGPAVAALPEALRDAARRAWTGAAFQEHRTGAACAATLQSMIEARAPLDLIALATRFPLDELVHVELCARIASELGGGVALEYTPDTLVSRIGAGLDPLLRASHQVVAYFCVGEALSIPLLHGTWKACAHPLTRAVLKRIVVDEADHGTFGWSWLDWVNAHLTDDDRAALADTARAAIAGVEANWDAIRARPPASPEHLADLGWMQSDAYLALAEASLERHVRAPLRARGIAV